MTNFPIALILATDAVARQVNSARPDAPVVPYVEPLPRTPRTLRARAAIATALRRAAIVVEPAR